MICRLSVIFLTIFLVCSVSASAQTGSACDLNGDGTVNVVDGQLAINMTLGVTPCTANIAGTGVCNSVVVQRVMNAALGSGCVVDHSVSLTWIASTSTGVTGYNLYRGTTAGGPYTKITSSPVSTTSYTDSNVQAGTTYYYVATAIASGTESAYSNQAPVVVPTP